VDRDCELLKFAVTEADTGMITENAVNNMMLKHSKTDIIIKEDN
jgi:hypothetical protein